FTFFATAGSIARLGAKPVFADIDPATFNIAPEQVKAKLTQKTKAIMPVHLFGQLADMEAINDIARAREIPVIEDAAQAIGIKLKRLDAWHEGRRRNAALYDKLLASSKVTTPRMDEGNWSIYNQYVVRVPNRDAVKTKLADAGIGSAVYYPVPLHLQECFAYL